MAQAFIYSQSVTLPVPVSQGGTGGTTSTGTGAVVLNTTPTINQPNLVGIATVTAAAAGSVGEFLDSGVVAGAALTTTAVAQNIVTLSLTAGDWMVTGALATVLQASTTTAIQCSVTLTSATLSGRGATGFGVASFNGVGETGIGDVSFNPYLRVLVSVTTNVYMVCQGNWTGAGPLIYASLTAERRR